MKALVTGATGFIGSHLVEALLEKNMEVRCLIRPRSDKRWLAGLEVEQVLGDCRNADSLAVAVAGVQRVYHLAGLVRARLAQEAFQTNATGTCNLIQACMRHNPGIQRFVHVSSQAAAGPSRDGRPVTENDPACPISAYGWSKLLAEKQVLQHKDELPVVIVRPSPVYGPRDRDFRSLFKLVKLGLSPVIGRTRRYIQLTYVGDVVRGICLAAESAAAPGGVFFLADHQTYSWREIGLVLGQVLNKKTHRLFIPESVSWLVARTAELWAALIRRPAIINRDKRQEMLQRYWLCDTTQAREQLGFQIRHPLPAGAEHTIRWYREHGWL